MKVLIVYDSFFGNTEAIAKAMCGALDRYEVSLMRVDEVSPEAIKSANVLIIGSPTRAFRPSEKMQKFLKGLSADDLHNMRVATFDTRIGLDYIQSAIGRFFVGRMGYAAKPMSDRLKKLGGRLSTQPEGFLVKESEGPLVDGEIERAADWAKAVAG